jgi:hypothetical protein
MPQMHTKSVASEPDQLPKQVMDMVVQLIGGHLEFSCMSCYMGRPLSRALAIEPLYSMWWGSHSSFLSLQLTKSVLLLGTSSEDF